MRLRFAQRVARFLLGQHGETGRNIGFKAVAAQHALAEAVDRHDGKAARRIDHGRKEAGRSGQFGAAGRPAEQLRQIAAQRLAARRRPFAELRQNARRHFGGGVLREGEAEDRAGGGSGKEQPQHSLDEHMGLPRPGIRPHPG